MLTLTIYRDHCVVAWGVYQVTLPYRLAASLSRDLGVGKLFVSDEYQIYSYKVA
jgi:hypothetical protein